MECATSSTSPTGNVTGEEVLRQAFPSVRLESFPSEAEMVAKLSVRKNAVGLANRVLAFFEDCPLLEAMESRFPGCHLQRRKAGALLRFHVPARSWHELFIGMEKLLAEELIHEYLVSDVSLTEVFRHFTKHKRTPTPTPASTPAISPAFTPAHAPTSSQCPSLAQV
ncbi:hypothetical protein MRX96_038775 [Rhipicephalus microplus]